MLAAAVLFAACDDKDNKYDFEEELSRSGKGVSRCVHREYGYEDVNAFYGAWQVGRGRQDSCGLL